MNPSVVELASTLIRCRPVNGSPGLDDAFDLVETQLSGLGLDCEVVSEGGARRLLATHAFAASGPHVIVHGHIDVEPVPVPDRTAAPADAESWPGEVRGGRVYGAGASDMLGGVAATIVSVRDLLDRTALSGRITVQLVVGGHPHGEGVTDLCGRAGLPGADLAVLTEPTDRQVCTTAYGYGSHRLSSVGAPGAMAFSNDGDNAATHAATALLALNAANGWLQELYPTRQDIRYIMPGRIHAGQSAPAPAVEAYVDFAMALPPLLPEEVALDVIRQNMLDRFTVAGMPLPVWERTGPRLLPADLGHSAFAKLLRDVNPALGWGQYPCPSDARAFQDAGIPIVVYGPGDLCRSRRPGEYVEVDELHEFVTTFATALGRQLSDGGER